MGIREDVEDMKKQLNEVREENIALEILKDLKKTNKRMFTIIVIILSMWFATIGYLVYVLNDIGTTSETMEIQDVDNIEHSDIKLGDN